MPPIDFEAVQALLRRCKVIQPLHRILVPLANIVDSGYGIYEENLEIALVQQPLQQHVANNDPLQAGIVIGPRKYREVAEGEPRTEIMQIGFAIPDVFR